MKVLRNLALAGTVAVVAALSAGTASAYHGNYGNYGHGHYGQSRLCHVPFFKLVRWFGYFQAKRIQYRCYYRNNYYGNYGY